MLKRLARRKYSFHDAILYPIDGPGIIQLESYKYNLLLVFKRDPENARKQLSAQQSKGIIRIDDAQEIEQLAKQFGFI